MPYYFWYAANNASAAVPCGHEDEDRPLAPQRLVGDVDELAVVEGGGLEGLDLGVDQRHGALQVGWVLR